MGKSEGKTRGKGWEQVLNAAYHVMNIIGLGEVLAQATTRRYKNETEYAEAMNKIFAEANKIRAKARAIDTTAKPVSQDRLNQLQQELTSLWNSGVIGSPAVQDVIAAAKRKKNKEIREESLNIEAQTKAENERVEKNLKLVNDLEQAANHYENYQIARVQSADANRGAFTRARGANSKVTKGLAAEVTPAENFMGGFKVEENV